MDIYVCAIGRVKSKPIIALYEDYVTRMKWRINLIEMEAKEGLTGEAKQEAEGKLLLQAVPQNCFKIVLDENGKQFTSRELASQFEKIQVSGYSKIAFLIGGADGHAKSVIKQADLLLSLGKLTWPHMLVRVMLAEQIYRVYSIISGHPYHK